MESHSADRDRSSGIDYRLLVPLLIATALVQIITAVTRISTSYRAVELQLSVVWIGVIAATFAIFPILIAVQIGRFIDRGHDAHTAWFGATLFVIAATGFVLWPTATGLLVSTAVLGTGHICLMASQQMLSVRAAGPRHLEQVLGNYMVAGAIGQALGPYVVGWAGGGATVPPTGLLFTVALAISAVSLITILSIRPDRTATHEDAGDTVVPIAALLKTPGVAAVIVTGIVIVSASDIILVYIPLLGAERHIGVQDIGWLLTTRAAASMVARLFYVRLVEALGRWPLMIVSAVAYAGAFVALAIPLSFWAMIAIMAVMGFSFGLATTLSITIVVDMTERGAQGTANSLRIMGNRIGQFALPFGASLVAAAAGLSGLFLLIAAAVAASAAAMYRARPDESEMA